jgi:hypothetical protein
MVVAKRAQEQARHTNEDAGDAGAAKKEEQHTGGSKSAANVPTDAPTTTTVPTAASTVVLKLSCGRDMRRIKLATNDHAGRTLAGLNALVRRSFPKQLRGNFELSYTDEEDDVITIGSDDDVCEAIDFAAESRTSLRVVVSYEEEETNSAASSGDRGQMQGKTASFRAASAFSGVALATNREEIRERGRVERERQKMAYQRRKEEQRRREAEANGEEVLTREECINHLQRFYKMHNPEKISTIRDIMKRFEGREMQMLDLLYDKYDLSNPYRAGGGALARRWTNPEVVIPQ